VTFQGFTTIYIIVGLFFGLAAVIAVDRLPEEQLKYHPALYLIVAFALWPMFVVLMIQEYFFKK